MYIPGPLLPTLPIRYKRFGSAIGRTDNVFYLFILFYTCVWWIAESITVYKFSIFAPASKRFEDIIIFTIPGVFVSNNVKFSLCNY